MRARPLQHVELVTDWAVNSLSPLRCDEGRVRVDWRASSPSPAMFYERLIEGGIDPQPHPNLLRFELDLPANGMVGRWREQGSMSRREPGTGPPKQATYNRTPHAARRRHTARSV